MYDLMLKYCPVCGGEFRTEIQTCGTCEVTLLSGGEMQYHERNTMKPDYVCNDCGRELLPNEYDKLSETFCPECGGQLRENTQKNWCYPDKSGNIIGPVYDLDIRKAYQEKTIDLQTQIYHVGKFEWKPLRSWDLLNSVTKAVPPATEEPSQLVAEENTEKTLLVTCESCSNKISKRAEACPKCGWKPQVMCQICHQKIPFDSTLCPECGDPEPFNHQAQQLILKKTKITGDNNTNPKGKTELYPSAEESQSTNVTAQEETSCGESINSALQVRPWVRFWARMFDMALFGFPAGFVIGFIYPNMVSDPGGQYIIGFIILLSWAFVEAGLLSTLGTTPGKALFKIKLMSTGKAELSYSKALSRSIKVWWRGLGIGFPIIHLVTQIVAYYKLTRNHITSWDADGGFIVTHERVGPARVLIAIAFFIVYFLLIVFFELVFSLTVQS